MNPDLRYVSVSTKCSSPTALFTKKDYSWFRNVFWEFSPLLYEPETNEWHIWGVTSVQNIAYSRWCYPRKWGQHNCVYFRQYALCSILRHPLANPLPSYCLHNATQQQFLLVRYRSASSACAGLLTAILKPRQHVFARECSQTRGHIDQSFEEWLFLCVGVCMSSLLYFNEIILQIRWLQNKFM